MLSASKFLVTAAATLVMTTPAMAQSAAQGVVIEVGAVSIIAMQGPTALTIESHKAGAGRVVNTEAATYAVTTNQDNRRLSVSIDEPLPAGVTLTMNVAAPAGGMSYSVDLSTIPQTAVAGISRLNASGLAVTYSITTAPGARIPTSLVRNVSMVIEAGAAPVRIIASAGEPR